MRPRRSRPTSSTRAVKSRSGWRKYPPSSTRRPDRAPVATTTLALTPLPPRSRLASARAIDQRRRAEARQHVDQQHFAAIGFDDLMADDLIAGIVAALHQHARLDLRDQFYWRGFFKDHDKLYRFQPRQHFPPPPFVPNRPPLAPPPLRRFIA